MIRGREEGKTFASEVLRIKDSIRRVQDYFTVADKNSAARAADAAAWSRSNVFLKDSELGVTVTSR